MKKQKAFFICYACSFAILCTLAIILFISHTISVAYLVLMLLMVSSLATSAFCVYKIYSLKSEFAIKFEDKFRNQDSAFSSYVNSVNTALTLISIITLVISIAIPILTYAFTNEEQVRQINVEFDKKINELSEATYIQNQITKIAVTTDLFERIDLCDKLLEKYPQNIEIHILRGNTYHDIGQSYEAIKDYEYVLSNGCTDSEVMESLASAYLNLDNYDNALRYYNMALEKSKSIGKETQYIYYGMANVYFDSKLYSEAIKYYSSAIEADPELYMAFISRAESYMLNDQIEEACLDLDLVLQEEWHNKNISDAYMIYGDIKKKLKDYDSAIKYYKASVEKDPGNDVSYFNLGYCYSVNGEGGLSIEMYSKAIKLDNKCSSYYGSRGIEYIKMNDLDAAEKDLELSYKYAYKDVDLYQSTYNLAYFYCNNRNDYEKALEYLENAIQYHKNASLNELDKIYNLKGFCYYYLDNPSEAIENYKKAFDINPSPIYYRNLGHLYFEIGENDLSKEYYEKAYQLELNGIG